MSINMNKIKNQHMKPLDELSSLSKFVAQEGIVLLENKKNVLPIIDKHVAVFGRIQFNYYKSGTGSGGLVNVDYVPSIIESMIQSPNMFVDPIVYDLYKKWVDENPFNAGNGSWASEPWMQEEMEVDSNFIRDAALRNDVGIVIIGRTAGEDKDNYRGPGSYYLTQKEDALLKEVSLHFKKTILIFNVGNPVDLSFMDQYSIDGLVFAWHGGGHGARALVDVLSGYVSPSGKLPMTIVRDLKDLPSDKNFGNKGQVIYDEDIYVGYRYFETFNKESVRYPFGFGLSYSKFDIKPISFNVIDQKIEFKVTVKNIGKKLAKEVVQIYVESPQGLLGKPKRVLVGFAKTKGLQPDESTDISISIDFFKLASYDDEGVVYLSSYVLEKGDYNFYIGNSVRNTKKYGKIELKDNLIIEKLEELNAPVTPFKRLKPDLNFNQTYVDTPLRTTDYNQRIKDETKTALPTNNNDYSLLDVHQNRISLNDFVGSLTVDELIQLTRGEGMSSPKVTAGTAAAFGGVTPSLLKKGIPVACAADGPSGIRMDSGFYASSLPIGTLLASTFNPDLVESLHELVGKEMLGYEIDVILGPGMNIQRHPLNGRNFEYFSEDPLLTGIMGAAATIGLHKAGVSGTLKHVFANNQETDRFNVDAVISERAQREIYLKGFEIAVKMGKAKAIMTAYNPINGLWAASNYDVNKKMIHDEWGFDGIIVTDWWAKMNDFGDPNGNGKNTKAMIISQNDVYMVITDSLGNSNQDNSKESYENNTLSLSHLQTTGKHILKYLLHTPAFYRMHQIPFKKEVRRPKNWFDKDVYQASIPLLNSIEVNDKNYSINPYVYNQSIKDIEKFGKLSAKADLIDVNSDFNHAVVLKVVDGESHVYHLYALREHKETKKLVDLDALNVNIYPKVKEKAWEAYIIPLSDFVEKNDAIIFNQSTFHVVAKDGLISYPIHITTSGKYVFDFGVSSGSAEQSQNPFSIFVDNLHQSTITIHGTNNQKIGARAFVLMEQGNHIMTFRFNKSNMTIHEIKMMRHG